MGIATSARFTMEMGFTAPVALRAANVALPRILPVARWPAERTPVRWTLSQGTPAARETRAPRSA